MKRNYGNQKAGRPADLKSAAELAANKSCGTRIRYMGGCRCLPCRAANSAYETKRAAARRAGNSNGLVPAKRAQKHIIKLSGFGFGRRAVAAAASIPESTIYKIKTGKRLQIRADTERRVLAVTPEAANGAGNLIDARATWAKIKWMVDEGLTESEIARRLGSRARRPQLQIRRHQVTGATAMKISKLYNQLRLGDDE